MEGPLGPLSNEALHSPPLPLIFHPALTVIGIFKQCYGLFAAGFRAEELAGDALARLCITEVCCPQPEAHAGSHEGDAPLGASIAMVRPPLALRRGEAGHIENEAGHG